MAKTNIVGWQGPPDQTQTYTTSADMSTAAAISPAPETGKKLLVDGVTIGIGSVAGEWFLQKRPVQRCLQAVSAQRIRPFIFRTPRWA